ncbi:MAG: hypothetical protein RIQ56_578, partial [Candidatus Parcubacteria bacterium]
MSFFIAAPLLYFPYAAGEAYRGINIPQFGNDQHTYLSRGKEVLEGHPLGQPFLAEGKGVQDPTFNYAERILLSPVVFLGQEERVDIVTYFNIANTVGVFFLALVLYAFVYSLTKDRLLSVSISVFVLGGYSIVYTKTLFYTDFNSYGRSIYPYASSVPFFVFLILLYRRVIEDGKAIYLLGSTFFFGSLFYIYFYAWTFATAFLGSLFLGLAVLKQWRKIMDVAIIGVGGLVIGSGMLWNFVPFLIKGLSDETSYYVFASYGRHPVMSLVGLFLAAIFVVYAYLAREESVKTKIFFAALIAAGWIALNQQLITGRYVQYGHYYWYFVVPLGIILGGYMAARLLPTRFRVLFACSLIILALVNTVGGQLKSFPTSFEDKLREQDFAPILRELGSLPSGVVFLGADGNATQLLVTIYTSHDLYWVFPAGIYSYPKDRVRDALLVHLFLDTRSRKDPVAFLKSGLEKREKNTFSTLYGDLEGIHSGLDYYEYQRRIAQKELDPHLKKAREELLTELQDEYKSQYESGARVKELLERAGVQYILWDKKIFPHFDISALSPGP